MKDNIKYLKLQYLRKKVGCKQMDFAKIIGLSNGQYSKKENGSQKWTLEECKLLSDYINKALGTSYTLDEIFFSEKVAYKQQNKGA